jgi:hypothetical protein
MSTYSAKYWKDRADEIRDIRDNITGEEPRRILAEIAAEFDRLHDWTLKQSGPSKQQQGRSGVQSIFGCHAGSQVEKMSWAGRPESSHATSSPSMTRERRGVCARLVKAAAKLHACAAECASRRI